MTNRLMTRASAGAPYREIFSALSVAIYSALMYSSHVSVPSSLNTIGVLVGSPIGNSSTPSTFVFRMT
ncbi:MAG: hypothetical protein ACE3JQ_01860 [Paenisporosarcina sp.]